MISKSAIWDKGFVFLWTPVIWGPNNCKTSSQHCANSLVFQRKYGGYSQRMVFVAVMDGCWLLEGISRFCRRAECHLSQQHWAHCVCQSTRERTGAILRVRDGKGMGRNQRSRTGSSGDWSRFCQEAAETWTANETYRTKAMQKQWKMRMCSCPGARGAGAELPGMSCPFAPITGLCPASPPHMKQEEPQFLCIRKWVFNQFFQTLIASLFFLILS